MGFGELLGNGRVKMLLESSLRKNSLSHCYLIAGPVGSGRRMLARLLSQAMQCTAENAQDRPCGRCTACRKVAGGKHPDVITVDDAEKVHVPIQLIRDKCADIVIRPNEGRHKIYVIPRADSMLRPAQNALLRITEEPPSYGVFILISENPEVLLPTIRSRSVILNMTPLDNEQIKNELRRRDPALSEERAAAAAVVSEGWLGKAIAAAEGEKPIRLLSQSEETFAEAFASGDRMQLLKAVLPLEKMKRENLLPELQRWQTVLAAALTASRDPVSAAPYAEAIAEKRSVSDLIFSIEALRKAVDFCKANVNTGAITGMLIVLLRTGAAEKYADMLP